MLSTSQIEAYRRDGYAVASQLFSTSEVDQLRDHFMQMREDRLASGESGGLDPTSSDPLKQYPRIMQPHRWDKASLDWLIDPRINTCLTDLLGREPYAVQTMFYFKPAGSRGQALHQDQFYLRAQPGTCMAAWMAVDHCNEENGCLHVVPGTQDLPVLCTEEADPQASFTDVVVPVPKSQQTIPVVMEPGDVLFFNGSVIHGSFPNKSQGRFRRAMIGHYIVGEAEKVGQHYRPVLRMNGSVIEMEASQGGGPCGVWVDRDGEATVELVG